MRLDRVAHRHGPISKLKLAFMRLMGGHEPPDIVKTILYRPAFFGAPFSSLMQSVLRGPSDFSVGERELMAAFVSRINQCVF
jgi:hypothetical protein